MMSNEYPLQITLGTAPSQLLQRYVVSWTANSSSVEQYVFGAEGGVINRVYSTSSPPDKINLNLTVDFTVESGISGFTKLVEIPLKNGGYTYFFEPGQLARQSTIYFDLPWNGFDNDYLLIEWKYVEEGRILSFGSNLLTKKDLTNLIKRDFYFLEDPDGNGLSGKIQYEITGRLHTWHVMKFFQEFTIVEASGIVIRPEYQNDPVRFILKVVS